MVEGEVMAPRVFQGRDGEWRASLDVTAQAVKFLGGRGEAGAPAIEEQGGVAESIDEEEIPF